jgi:hypothetical protein
MDAAEFSISGVSALDMSDPEPGWTDRAVPDVVGMPLGAVCGADGPIFVQDGTEATYDVSTDRWVSRPAAVPADVILQPTVARSAVGPGGDLFVLASSGALWRRSPDGQWAPQDTGASALVSTDDAVFGATASDTTLVFAPLPE